MRYLSIVALFFALLSSYPARAQVIAIYDFEDGTVQGWTSFNGSSTPANTTAEAFSGTHSLLTTTNSTGETSGPGISLSSILLPGATYTITGEVRLTSGESATNANFEIERFDPACSGGRCFDIIGNFQVPVNASSWAQIGGSYTVSSTETGLFLFAQLIGPSTATSFYLDDVMITETSAPPSAVPEPSTWAMMLLGFAGLGFAFRQSRRKVAFAK
jgi:endo-1,4-beta-xylanase